MFREFKTFIFRASVLDLAIGIVLGVAFGLVVSSFVNDILMPPIGLLLGHVDFANLFVNLTPDKYNGSVLADAKKAGAATWNYGLFINTVLNFVIIAFVVFLIMNQANRFKKPVEVVAKSCPFCQKEIPIKATRCAFCTSALTA